MTKTRKPKLASGERITVRTDTGSPGLGSATVVTTSAPKKEPLHRRATRQIIGLVVLVAMLLAATYVTLAITVVVVMHADNHNVLVLRNTFPVGAAPAGEVVYASSDPVDTKIMTKINQAVFGVPAGSVVKIVAGPSATIRTNQDGYIVADDKVTDYRGNVDARTLKREYVAICLAGACEDGAAVIVGQSNIVGGVKGYLGLTGLTHPDTE